MVDDNLLDKVNGLSDLELALLLCLINREHCIISTPHDALDNLAEELQLIASRTFGLKWLLVDCTPDTTLEEFASSLLLPSAQTRSSSPARTRTPSSSSYFSPARGHLAPLTPAHPPAATPSPLLAPGGPSASSPIASVILARNLSSAPRAVQIQALELLRTRRIFTRTAVQTAPKQFLFVAVEGAEGGGGAARLTGHLNDAFFLAHWHDPEDGFVNIEEAGGGAARGAEDDLGSETASTESVLRKSVVELEDGKGLLEEGDIGQLARLSQQVQVDVDVTRYAANIASFLRVHRAVAGGISPVASRHMERLAKSLAPLNKIDFVTPAIVALAARKIYLHRIRIVEPEKERSMQWGSNAAAVKALLDGIGPEEVIEDVLAAVGAPP